MQIDVHGQKKIRSVANWMLALLCVLFVDIILLLSRLVESPLESVVLLAMSAWLSVSAARAAYWFSRPLSPENLRLGLLGLRSFFRALLIGAFVNAVVAVSSGSEVKWAPPRDGGGERSSSTERQTEQALASESAQGMSAALTERLEGLLVAMLSSCQDHKSDRCTEALFRAGSPIGALKPMPEGFVRAAIGRRCRRDNFARIEFEATYRHGKESLEAVFVRSCRGQWAFLALEQAPDPDAPFLCDQPPYHDAVAARTELEASTPAWVVVDGTDQLDLSKFQFYSCAIDEVVLDLGKGRPRGVLDLGCWVEDGFSFDKRKSTIELPSPAPSKVTVVASFTDGSSSSWVLSNPAEPEPEPEPEPELEPEPETETEPKAGTPTLEDATTYAEAAAILEPCWRMLGDDLPVRTGTRCAEAYDRTLGVVGADGGRLSEVLRQAAEVGRAWNDADAALSVVPAPSAAGRRKIEKQKRRAYRREAALLQARTVALLDFARRAFAEVEGGSDCDRRQGLLLQALVALPVEFDEAAKKSVMDLAGVGAAVEHARTSLRRAEEACVSRRDDPEGSRFRGDAKKMILDALELGTARKEHSRCMDGRLEQVCARPGGLDPHLRLVVFDAIRTLARR